MNASSIPHVLLAGALAVSTAFAQAPQLLTPISNPSATAQAFVAQTKKNNSAITRTSFVRVDTAALRGVNTKGKAPFATFGLNVFENSYMFDLNHVSTTLGYQVYKGTVQGQAGDVTITVAPNDVVFGVIDVGGKLAEVGYAADPGFHMLRDIDSSKLPPCGGAIPVGHPGRRHLPAQSNTAKSSVVYWDVLLAYTPAAKVAAGGTASVEAECVSAIAIANTANTESSVDAEFRLAYMDEVVGYTEGTFGEDLSRLRSTTDGIMDEVHTWRAKYCADMVGLLRAGASTYCGLGYLMSTPGGSAAFASSAFTVTHRNCISYNSVTHEMGHNMGCNHDRANAGSGGVFSYSYGWRTSGSPVYRSLMAYAPGTRVSRWSGPSVTYSGQTMGTTTENNARSCNNVKQIVADWVGGCSSTKCLSTTMAGGNGLTAVNSGNMFNMKVYNAAGINVTSMGVRSRLATGTFDIEVYITPGSYNGKDTNAAVWTLASKGSATSAGSTVPTDVDVDDFFLPQGKYGMYVLYLNGGIHYTNGNTTNQLVSNPDLALSLGIAKTAKFGGSTFNPRVWNGKICYSTDDVAALGHYGWGCGASATGIPQWSWDGPPALGAKIRGSITGMNPAGGPVFWWIGLINNGGVDISAIGMPDCSLFSFPIGMTLGLSQAGGTRSGFGFNIPNNVTYIGAKIGTQIGAIDPGANALGVSMTDAVAMRVGN
jgi:hypothetical protein